MLFFGLLLLVGFRIFFFCVGMGGVFSWKIFWSGGCICEVLECVGGRGRCWWFW